MTIPDVNVKQKIAIDKKDHDSSAQTTVTGSTVYSLLKRPADQDVVDLVLMIINEDGPRPMLNMRPAKKQRNAVDQFYDEHQEEYEARGQSTRNQIDCVHTHNNAYPRMYDELQKRQSIAQRDVQLSSNQNIQNYARFNSCRKRDRRKQRIDKKRKEKKGRTSKKCRDSRTSDVKKGSVKKDSKNKLQKVTKRIIPKPKKHTRRRSISKTSIICSNKCFQCYLTAETKTKSVSALKSVNDILSVQQEFPPNTSVTRAQSNEKNDSKSFTQNKKRVAKKVKSTKSQIDLVYPDTESQPSVSSYNSYMSTEHEPMVE